jgi:hypothetical protein
VKSAASILPHSWAKYLCVPAFLYALVVSAFIFVESAGMRGARDFHQFWYAGHFILQGRDPYAAFFAKEQPQLPIHYLDGITVSEGPVAQGDLEITPSNTPLMLLLITPFSALSWQSAKWSFLVINMFLMLATGWLVLRQIPFAGRGLHRFDELLLFLLYFDLSATRIAIENGQTTLSVFLMMLVVLLTYNRAWPVAGIALGLALSKYSLSIPILLFVLYKGKFNILILAGLVQVVGVLGLSALTAASPLTLVEENIRIFRLLLGQPGIHLSHWLGVVADTPLIAFLPALGLSLFVFVPLFLWTRAAHANSAQSTDIIDYHILTLLFLWSLLVAYHRVYDTLILLLFFTLVFKGLAYPNLWRLAKSGQNALLLFLAFTPLLMILPARLIDRVIPFYYESLSDGGVTILLITMLLVSMFLLWRYVQILRMGAEISEPHQGPPADMQTKSIQRI